MPQTSSTSSSSSTPTPDFTATIRPYLRNLRKRAQWLSGGREFDSDDLLQETLLKAHLNWHKWQELPNLPGNPLPWLYSVMYRIFCDSYKKQLLRQTAQERHAEQSVDWSHTSTMSCYSQGIGRATSACQVGAEVASPASGVISDELAAALETVSPEWREALVSVADGDTHSEIAAKLRIPRGTAMSRAMRARRVIGRQQPVIDLARREYGMAAELPVYSDPYEDKPRKQKQQLAVAVAAAAG